MLVGRVGQLGCRFLKSGWLVPDIKAPCELPEPPQALSLTAAARQPQSCPVRGPAASSSTQLPYGFLLSQEIQPLGTCSSCPQHECSVPPVLRLPATPLQETHFSAGLVRDQRGPSSGNDQLSSGDFMSQSHQDEVIFT